MDDELEMMAGIREGCGPYRQEIMPWVNLKIDAMAVTVNFDPPGQPWKMDTVILSEVPRDRLTAFSKLLGHNIAAYYRKNKRHIKDDQSDQQRSDQ